MQTVRSILLALFGSAAVANAVTASEWTSVINMAGRQRMLSQRMSKEFLMVAKGIDTNASKAAMVSTVALFDTSLGKLVNGASADGIIAAPNSGISTQLSTVQGLWTEFKALLTDYVDASPISDTVLEDMSNKSNPLLVQMNSAVVLYLSAAGAAAPGAVVNIAGRQRMLSQRMSKDALLVSMGIMTTRSLGDLQTYRNLFATSFAGLKDGSSSMSLPGTNDSCILTQLDVIEGIWNDFSTVIDAVISAGAITTTQLTTIATLSLPLLTESNVAVTQYVEEANAGSATCVTTTVTTTLPPTNPGSASGANALGAGAVRAIMAVAVLRLVLFMS